MEHQTNINATSPDNTSGANTVLLAVVIILLTVGGYLWYTSSKMPAEIAEQNPSIINVDVQMPTPEETTTTEATDTNTTNIVLPPGTSSTTSTTTSTKTQ